MRVKICGITRKKDALICMKEGVHALGLIFYKGSPRCVTPDKAKEIIRTIPPLVCWVGVFVDETVDKILELSNLLKLSTVQLHGSESPHFCNNLRKAGLSVIKAIRVSRSEDLEGWEAYKGTVSALLLDTKVEGTLGGTGCSFPWEIAKRVTGIPVILAGGLRPGRVKEAINTVKPWGIDVCSGVEKTHGVKDPNLIKALMKEVSV